MRWFTILLLFVTLPSVAAAQDCPDGTVEGMSPTGNPCQLCRNGALESLPPRTTCGDEDGFSCDENGAFRTECVLIDPDGDATMCMADVPKGPACPSGLLCDITQSTCRTFCASAAECQDGYECVDDECVLPDPPDMGVPDMGGSDMGGPDMGGSDMDTEDMGSGADLGSPDDMDGADGSNMNAPKLDDDSGCCAVISDRAEPSPVWFILTALLVWRRRA